MAISVSVVMANYNAAPFIADAVEAVFAQTGVSVDLIIADDGSTDGSLAALDPFVGDDRLRILTGTGNGGPGAARNRALEVTTGDWVAIVDSDDLILPHRFARLIEIAEEASVDAVADDLAYFGDPETEGTTLMGRYGRQAPWELTPQEYMRSHLPRFAAPPFGYLKPMFRQAALADLRYDETLRIGEDSDFLLRFLLGGNRMVLTREALYRYRRRAGSISHRLSPPAVRAMIENCREMAARLPPDLAPLMDERRVRMEETLAFQTLVDDLKGGRVRPALKALAGRPRLAMRLAGAAREGVARRIRRKVAAE